MFSYEEIERIFSHSSEWYTILISMLNSYHIVVSDDPVLGEEIYNDLNKTIGEMLEEIDRIEANEN